MGTDDQLFEEVPFIEQNVETLLRLSRPNQKRRPRNERAGVGASSCAVFAGTD